LAEYLVVVTSLNEQNVFGTRDFLKHVGIEVKGRGQSPKGEEAKQESEPTPEHLGPKPTILVASPVPVGEIKFKQERFAALQEEFGIRPTKLSYHPQIALIESIFVRDYPEEYLAVEYQELTNRIMALAGDHESQLARRYRDRWEKEKGERAAAVQDVIRLAPQSRPIGESLLRQLPGQFKPEKEDEFIAADQMYAILGQLAQPVHARAWIDQAWNLRKWADWTQDPDLRMKRFDNAIRLFTEAIEMPEATVEQRAEAYLGRGLTFGKKGEMEKAIADFIAVIEMPEAPVEQKARAYVGRGQALGEKGEPENAIRDFTVVIEMPEAKIEVKESAYGNLGFWLYKKGEYEKSIEASRKALEINPSSSVARANLGIALLHVGDTKRALAEYKEIFAKIQDPEQLDREVITDIREALNAGRKVPGATEVLNLAEQRRKELQEKIT
jgi:tetratricopeptide (TPR) repeat protein